MTSTRDILAQTGHAATGSTASNEKKETLQLADSIMTPRTKDETIKVIFERRKTNAAKHSEKLAKASSALAAGTPVQLTEMPPTPATSLRRSKTI